ncbi:hypothetical protein E0485_05065 [Paenibacillus albiflavus]|uniref:Uncharacterized protein n=1 Tax=Paenibacillus albiflavus TaxID=2545760 RepID=A0A4R4DZX5_9BACL|nr:hypothetical protein [Paenibacillus albiflavus]TCZ68317.1 hypothetical protein E0485_24400 [Paenibacillus albiflavus]TCZ79244.1 hypothetical protein E0485_05065 [Paenibacillus albiflavus]
MPQAKKLIALCLTILFICLVLFVVLERKSAPPMITEGIMNAIEQSEHGQKLALQDYTDFEWDSVYILRPYMDPADLTMIKGAADVDSMIKYHDHINLILFVRLDIAVKYLDLSRKYDFTNEDITMLKRDEAVFTINKSEGHIILQP